jgi:hypothetical protein
LREAVERVGKLYGKDGKAGAPPELAAVHIGFSSPHGQAMSVLAALKKFGLVAEAGGRVVPTQRAIEIANLSDGDPRRMRAIREAVMEPPIYRELIDQHRDTGWPADDVLASELVTYKNFNPNAVAAFVSELKDSLEYAGLSSGLSLESVNEGEAEAEQAPAAQAPMPQAAPQKGRMNFSAFFGEEKRPMQRTYSFGLSENVNAKVEITGAAEVEDLEALRDYVDTLIKSWKRKQGRTDIAV